MTARRWQLVEGRVYKLSRVFDNCIDALHHARILNNENHAVLIKTGDCEWAIYWRPKDEAQCEANAWVSSN
jgi:hypothetical protein